jgi:hypothetical protein
VYGRDDFVAVRKVYTLQVDPLSTQEALNRPDASQWRSAMGEELASLHANNTWELVDLPPGRRAIKCKWVFKTKCNADGSIERYKARLVAKGYSQREGIDYTATFSPTLKHTSIRLLLALAAANDWEIHQVDVATAFLNGTLEDEIYMEQPKGFIKEGDEHLVCKLIKSLYGLKQAGRVWNEEINAFLCSVGFYRSLADPCIYVRLDDPTNIIGMHVDDECITGSTQEAIDRTKSELSGKYTIKDLGPVKFLLGWEITRDREAKTLSISQKGYIERTLEKFGMLNCASVSTPMTPGVRLTREQCATAHEDVEQMDSKPYQALVGTLMYLMVSTRPDICHAVGVLAQFMHQPGKAHWDAAKRVLKYLKGTKSMQLTYSSSPVFSIDAYADADWAGDLDTRKSTSGFVVRVNGAAIAWASRKQKSVATSTFEAEYVAAAVAAKEVLWLRQLLQELRQGVNEPTVIKIDNQAALSHLLNPMTTQKSKHIDIQFHFVRDYIEAGALKYEFVPTAAQTADFLTKPVTPEIFARCRTQVGGTCDSSDAT